MYVKLFSGAFCATITKTKHLISAALQLGGTLACSAVQNSFDFGMFVGLPHMNYASGPSSTFLLDKVWTFGHSKTFT